jgi:hypothetical protein
MTYDPIIARKMKIRKFEGNRRDIIHEPCEEF